MFSQHQGTAYNGFPHPWAVPGWTAEEGFYSCQPAPPCVCWHTPAALEVCDMGNAAVTDPSLTHSTPLLWKHTQVDARPGVQRGLRCGQLPQVCALVHSVPRGQEKQRGGPLRGGAGGRLPVTERKVSQLLRHPLWVEACTHLLHSLIQKLHGLTHISHLTFELTCFTPCFEQHASILVFWCAYGKV